MKKLITIAALAAFAVAAGALAGDVPAGITINAVDAGACSTRLRHNVKYAILCEPATYVRLTHSDAGIPGRGDIIVPPERLYDFDTTLEERYICVSPIDGGEPRQCNVFERRICKGC